MNKEKDNLLDTMRKGRVYRIDPTLTHLDKRLVRLHDEPRCTCAEYQGDDPKCPVHGRKDGKS